MGYDNDEDALRREFGSATEPRRENGHNPGALVGAAQLQDPGEAESHGEETDREDRENGFITTR